MITAVISDQRYQSDELCVQSAACTQRTGWDQELSPVEHRMLNTLMKKHDHLKTDAMFSKLILNHLPPSEPVQ